MQIPRFLIGDHSDFSESIFVIHTEYPRFIINLVDDDITWLEDLEKENEKELLSEMPNLIEEASRFYDKQIDYFENKID